MQKRKPIFLRNVRAFTLVEILIAAAIGVSVVAGAAAITLQCLKTYFTDCDRLSMNHDMRMFTQQLEQDISQADLFYIYRDFPTAMDTNVGDSPNFVPVTVGQSGDFLLLLTINTEYTASTGTTTDTTQEGGDTVITGIVGYYRDDTGGNGAPGVMRRFQVNVAGITTPVNYSTTVDPITGTALPGALDFTCPAGTTCTLSSYAPFLNTLLSNCGITLATKNTNLQFAPAVIGNANDNPTATATNHFFYYLSGNAVMVNGQIQEQGNSQQTKAVDTYNLTIQTRG